MNKPMKTAGMVLAIGLAWQVNATGAELFHETFETNLPMAGILGTLDGQHGWSDPSSNAMVQTADVWEFDQAVSLSEAAIAQDLVVLETDVQVVFAWKPVAGIVDLAEISSDATAVCWVNTNGVLCAYSNEVAVEISSAFVSTSQWSRILVQSDYLTEEWSLWLDGVQVIDGFGFYTTAANFTGISFLNSAIASAYVDDIQISTNLWTPQPGDTDGDGLADDWEIFYFRSPNISSGGTANFDSDVHTDSEEEITGSDPTDSGSFFEITEGTLEGVTEYVIRWPSISGRLYDVDSSTNLIAGVWETLESDISATPPENTYTVLVDTVEARFIHVRVKIQ